MADIRRIFSEIAAIKSCTPIQKKRARVERRKMMSRQEKAAIYAEINQILQSIATELNNLRGMIRGV